TLRGPEADSLGAAAGNDLVHHSHGIEKIVAVAKLVAEPKQGHGLAGKIDLRQVLPELLPIRLNLAKVPGGNTQNNSLVVHKFQLGDIGNIVDIHHRFAQTSGNAFSDSL